MDENLFVNLTYGYMITDDVHLDCEDTTQINNQNYEFLNYKQWQDLFQETCITVFNYITNVTNKMNRFEKEII
jgi:hypothetical protein